MDEHLRSAGLSKLKFRRMDSWTPESIPSPQCVTTVTSVHPGQWEPMWHWGPHWHPYSKGLFQGDLTSLRISWYAYSNAHVQAPHLSLSELDSRGGWGTCIPRKLPHSSKPKEYVVTAHGRRKHELRYITYQNALVKMLKLWLSLKCTIGTRQRFCSVH